MNTVQLRQDIYDWGCQSIGDIRQEQRSLLALIGCGEVDTSSLFSIKVTKKEELYHTSTSERCSAKGPHSEERTCVPTIDILRNFVFARGYFSLETRVTAVAQESYVC